ncbi:MAG: hypothetical protein ABSG36_19655 [Acidimicrobiales bacterium]|jgi:hypothetical protein
MIRLPLPVAPRRASESLHGIAETNGNLSQIIIADAQPSPILLLMLLVGLSDYG